MAKMGLMRSTLTSTAKILATKSKPSFSSSSSNNTLTSKLFTSPFSCSPTRPVLSSFRLASVMLSVLESQKPLHSAIASARLNSILALDTTCWSSLSQAFAVPR